VGHRKPPRGEGGELSRGRLWGNGHKREEQTPIKGDASGTWECAGDCVASQQGLLVKAAELERRDVQARGKKKLREKNMERREARSKAPRGVAAD